MLFYHLDCFLAFAKVSGQIHALEFISEIILKVKCFTVPCFTECSIFRNILFVFSTFLPLSFNAKAANRSDYVEVRKQFKYL